MSVPRSRRVWLGALTALIAVTTAVFAAGARCSAAAVAPVRPGSLALGRNGVLYIADDARDQILALSPAGRFRVVAGDGTPGYSGDGGPALRAQIHDPAGMTVLGDGTLLFADQSNNRVRAVEPSGTIETIAGDGRPGWVQSGTQALRAHLSSPSALTVGPDGLVYMALGGANEIVRMEHDGSLTRIAGNRRYGGLVGVGGPALDASPAGPNGLAFDDHGDLYIAGFNTKALLMIDRGGIMRQPGGERGFYPRADGGIVRTRAGRVLAIDTQRVVELSPRGPRTFFDFAPRQVAGTHAFLPNGIAVAAGGSIYVDTYLGNGWTTRSAIAVITPRRSVRVLWRG